MVTIMPKKTGNRKKYYTVEEANRALPLVRAIVSDIVSLAKELRESYERLERIPPEPDSEMAEARAQEEANEKLRQGHAQMKEYVAELVGLGVELKDFQMGLVDFRTLLNGREVLLCWLLGEPEVAHWHEVDAGFVARKKLEHCSAEPRGASART
jgi:hypothetical protein